MTSKFGFRDSTGATVWLDPLRGYSQPMLGGFSGPFSGFGGFGDKADMYYDDPAAAYRAAFSQWSAQPGQSHNQKAWLQGQYGRNYEDYLTELERRNLRGDTQPYEWTDYLAAMDPNAQYAAATPGEKGLYRGRYAPYGGFQVFQ